MNQLGPLLLTDDVRLADERAVLQTGIERIDRRPRVRVAIEKSDGDFFAPFHGAIHSRMEIGRSVALVFQLVDAIAEPLVGVLLIEGHARTENVDQGEAGILDAVFIEFEEMLGLAAVAAGDVTTA